MDRATLRLELLRIAHHQAQGYQVTLDIAKHYEAAFSDLVLDDERVVPAPKPAPKKGEAKS